MAAKHRPPDPCGRPLNSPFRSSGLEIPVRVVLLPIDRRPRTTACDPNPKCVRPSFKRELRRYERRLSSLALHAHISARPAAGIDIATLAVERGSAARFPIGKTQKCRIGQLIGSIGIQVRAQSDQRSGERPPPSTTCKLRVQYEDIHQSPRRPPRLRDCIVRNAIAHTLRSLNECASAQGTGGGAHTLRSLNECASAQGTGGVGTQRAGPDSVRNRREQTSAENVGMLYIGRFRPTCHGRFNVGT